MTETIVARATPAGRGGVAVLRVSGPDAFLTGATLIGRMPRTRQAVHRNCRDGRGRVIDDVLILWFPGPRSFTGEDVLEIQCHGSSVVTDMLIQRILEIGPRLAEPGEFSRRAYLNDRLDLSQAEAIADLIESDTQAAARAAHRSLTGAFSAAVIGLSDAINELRVWVEAAIDFPDEDVDFLDDEALSHRMDEVRQRFDQLERAAIQGRLLRDGMVLVLAGRPNAGKSSLLNALAGFEAAIVTDVPGTTRDLVRTEIEIDGMPVHVVDTAGLRDPAGIVEEEGIRRAREELGRADHALLIVDAADPASAADVTALRSELPDDVPSTLVRNKIDLTGDEPGFGEGGTCNVSALTGAGIEALRDAIRSGVGFEAPGEGSFTARRRHVDAIRRSRQFFDSGCQELTVNRAGELMAEELSQAQRALGEIVGEVTTEELLGDIFSRFCIGK